NRIPLEVMTIKELVALLQASHPAGAPPVVGGAGDLVAGQVRFEGDGDAEIRRVTSLEDAGPEDLSFVAHHRSLKAAAASAAGCLLVPLDFSNPTQRTII